MVTIMRARPSSTLWGTGSIPRPGPVTFLCVCVALLQAYNSPQRDRPPADPRAWSLAVGRVAPC